MSAEPRESNCLRCVHAGRVVKGRQVTCNEYASVPLAIPWAAVESGTCRGFQSNPVKAGKERC